MQDIKDMRYNSCKKKDARCLQVAISEKTTIRFEGEEETEEIQLPRNRLAS